MAVISKNISDGSTNMQWVVALAFMGALYCTVLGVFKRFRASMNFGLTGIQQGEVREAPRAVYRPFGGDLYSSMINEGPYNAPPVSILESSQPSRPPREPSRKNQIKSSVTLSQQMSNGQLNPGSDLGLASRPGTSGEGTSKKSKSSSKSEDKGKKKEKEKTSSKSEDKLKSSKEKPKTDDKEKKKDKSKEKKKDEKVKVKKQKVDKDAKGKSKKTKKQDADTPKPVASVTIDEEAVASAQGTSKNPAARNKPSAPPPYDEGATVFKTYNPTGAKNVSANSATSKTTAPTNSQIESDVFESSWDQVALHRQNMQTSVKTFSSQPTNLRSMANMNKGGNNESINSLYTPSANSPRNNNPLGKQEKRLSPPDYSSGSDTEA